MAAKRMVLTNCEGAFGMGRTVAELREGAHRLDALEAGIGLVELDERARTVGRGGIPNLLGEMQCDASIMDGDGLRTGAVGAVRGCLHVASLARQVMERLPHVFLAGEGAERFAQECGLAGPDFLTAERAAAYAAWCCERFGEDAKEILRGGELAPAVWGTASPRTAKGTTVFLVSDGEHLAGAASTSGWGYKYPGRLGDSPVIGAGLYVDTRHGAAACTHTGEMTIRAATSVSTVRYMQKGASVGDACYEAFEDLAALEGGYLGAVVLHAVDRDGEIFVLSTGDDDDVVYWHWEEGMSAAVSARPVLHRLDGGGRE